MKGCPHMSAQFKSNMSGGLKVAAALHRCHHSILCMRCCPVRQPAGLMFGHGIAVQVTTDIDVRLCNYAISPFGWICWAGVVSW
jgi:hypothetical protein